MKFTIITHSPHKILDEHIYAYEPYVREMNFWIKNVTETKVIAPVIYQEQRVIDAPYEDKTVIIKKIPQINFTNFSNALISLLKLPIIFIKIIQNCYWADHIHLRCPGNIGLIGSFVQIFFPMKKKTVKYAGNWDPNSKQPLSYRIQKKILSNTFLTRNCKVLVYGEWEKSTRNIHPFFTASYSDLEIEKIYKNPIKDKLKLIYVGSLTKSKQPILSIKTTEILLKQGTILELNIYGNGSEYENLKHYIHDNNLGDSVFLHGNQEKDSIKKAFQEAHFLIFISKSEGWPKVVAEAMFWGCIPISSKVSCVPHMLGYGERGALVSDNVDDIASKINFYLNNEEACIRSSEKGKKWSQEFTLDKFELEISKLL